MSLHPLLERLGTEIEDPEEESFLLFSQTLLSQNLGFIDSKASVVEVAVGDKEFTIHQSPTILSSNRDGGTTGAVLWKVTPLFATWLASPDNPFSQHGFLSASSTVLELGCGIAGLVAMSVAPRIARYILTDQVYVMKLLQQNLDENRSNTWTSTASFSAAGGGKKMQQQRNSKHHASTTPSKKKSTSSNTNTNAAVEGGKISTLALDWECDLPVLPQLYGASKTSSNSNKSANYGSTLSSTAARGDIGSFPASSSPPTFMILACDCIYNDALIEPLTTTCAALCRRHIEEGEEEQEEEKTEPLRNKQQSLVVIAQQLRSPDVFETWLRTFAREFRVWRVPDEMLHAGLRLSEGFVVHVGVLKETP